MKNKPQKSLSVVPATTCTFLFVKKPAFFVSVLAPNWGIRVKNLFEEPWPAFQIEIQILNALERKHWSYEDLAKVLHTQKSAISRDLKSGGLRSASIARIAKMAAALGLQFFPVCFPEKEAKRVIPAIRKLAAA